MLARGQLMSKNEQEMSFLLDRGYLHDRVISRCLPKGLVWWGMALMRKRD
jgi:hypothetical protein